MYNGKLKKKLHDAKEKNLITEATLEAIKSSVACLYFTPDRILKDANSLFLDIVGLTLAQLDGQHHRELFEPIYAQAQNTKNFGKNEKGGILSVAPFPVSTAKKSAFGLKRLIFLLSMMASSPRS